MITVLIEAALIWFLRNAKKTTEQKQLHLIVLSILVAYLVGVFVVTIILRSYDDETKINLIPFRSLYLLTRQLVHSAKTWGIKNIPHELTFMAKGLRNFFGNILLLIPLGYLVPILRENFNRRWKAGVLGIGLSMAIEIVQLVSHRGFFDLDDVLLNSFGCVIGWLCYNRWLREKTT